MPTTCFYPTSNRCLCLGSIWLLALALSGCAVDRVRELDEALDAKAPEVRLASVAELAMRDDARSLGLLIEAMKTDPEILEEAGNAVVLIGRRRDKRHPDPRRDDRHPVLLALRDVAAGSHLDWQVRAKATWCLGEIGNRRAKPFIEGAHAKDSMRVAEEIAMARDKLGFTSEGCAFELLIDGRGAKTYHPEERWED